MWRCWTTTSIAAEYKVENVDFLWREYAKSRDVVLRNQLIMHYTYLVKSIVCRMIPTYKKHVDFDDLMSYGVLGLMDAVDRFDIRKEVKFETYASLRIKGEIIDQLRRQDWAPASLRQKIKRIEEGFEVLEARLGRTATEQEVAKFLSMSVEEVERTLDDSYTFNVVCLDEILVDKYKSEELLGSSQDSPELRFESLELREILADAIDLLPEKERLVISMYYYNEMNLKEIGLVLGVSESRVSQLHSKALMSLKNRLRGEG